VDAKPDAATQTPERAKRIVKRYSNRKLYDTKDSRYVTLLQIAEMLRSGEEVQIIDNNSKEDLTEVTLAQIIYEEKKANSRAVPLQTLKDLIHTRTEKVLSDLREGPIGRLIPGGKEKEKEKPEKVEPPPPPPPPESSKPGFVEQARGTFEDWQQKIDERIRAMLPSSSPWQQLEAEIRRLNARIDELEKKLKSGAKHEE
jgi:polyhydroxyalkanoate synthesis repressor PhaR